jgi:hypothetical protein
MKPSVDNMEFEFDSIKRETMIDPMYKKIDSNGKVYLDKKRAGEEVLIIAVKPKAGDKDRYLKVGR